MSRVAGIPRHKADFQVYAAHQPPEGLLDQLETQPIPRLRSPGNGFIASITPDCCLGYNPTFHGI
jgi:hypothetical protein